MNGEANGIMNDLKGTASPSEQDTALDTKKFNSDNFESTKSSQNESNGDSSINNEIDNNGDSESRLTESSTSRNIPENENSNEKSEDTGQSEDIINEKSEDTGLKPFESIECHENLTDNENSTNCSEPLNENCSEPNIDNSEESCPEPEVPKEPGDDNHDNGDSMDGEIKTETFKIVTIDKHVSDEEVESINSSDCSDEPEPRAEDTVSINSDSDVLGLEDSSQDSQYKSNDVIILENDGPENGNSRTPEVHEIDSDNDDCMVTDDDNISSKTNDKTKNSDLSIVAINDKTNSKTSRVGTELRRSSRAVKRKKYEDIDNLDESDIEEVIVEDPLRKRSKPIVINDTKKLVEMAAKQSKSNKSQKKEPTVVIIDSPVKKNSSTPHKPVASANSIMYQSIVARGTTVTPVNSKNTYTQVSHAHQPAILSHPQPAILPTLTDDMFVVEAPSFIVPYVYEKPPQVPFREFVDKLGKELDEEKAKEVKELQEKKKAEKEQRDKERQEKRERGEEVEESEEEVIETEEMKQKKAERKERRRRKKEEDDASWDGSDSSDSDDTISDEELKAAVRDNDDMKEIIQTAAAGSADPSTSKSESYFDLYLGKFFMNIGLNLVTEYVQTDLLKQQNRKLQREKKSGQSTKSRVHSISLLTKNLDLSKKNNEQFTFPQIKCEYCSFKTESALTMANHLETPHMKNNLYRCNFCSFEIKSPHDVLFHMEHEHSIKGRLERAPSLHQCANCPFEDNGKGKLARHLIACAKKFKPEYNLAPPVEWEHPAKIAKMAKPRNSLSTYPVSQFGRNHVDSSFGKVPISIANVMPAIFRARGRGPALGPRPVLPGPAAANSMRGPLGIRQPTPLVTTYTNAKSKMNSPISITPLPRQQPPIPVQPLQAAANSKGFVICEICDGYIKDLEQLRNHMQWIHKVKIHPKMIYNRPPLNCQKCQFRFFTDQGLERHLLGSHGLVTSSMQEAANKGKDAGRCPVCGRVYQWKLLSHVARDHNLTLKPAHLSYKCTVCTATFGMYKLFENHVYSAHSVVAKRVMDKTKGGAAPKASDAAKPLKINDEITITPQPVKAPAAAKGK